MEPRSTPTQSGPNLYPTLAISHIQNPNRFYAVPLLGGFIKVIMLIPVWLEAMVLALAYFFVSIINSLVVLLTGKYWEFAYRFNLGLMRFGSKIYFFFWGLTNAYPGFNLSTNSQFILDIAKPDKPSRVLAFPILGGVIRIVLLIPYLTLYLLCNRKRSSSWSSSFVFRGACKRSLSRKHL